MKGRTTWLLALALLAPAAGAEQLCSGFLPDNKMRIPLGALEAGGLTKAQFDAVLDKVEGIYAPIVAAHGGKLVVERRWDDGTVNASATRSGGQWFIHMYGGLARHPSMTQDGFALVACHELGHHLGGAPKVGGIGGILSRWASNEGEADYAGSLKCARRVFADADTASFTRAAKAADAGAQQACDAAFKGASDRAICARATQAGLSLATVLSMLGNSPQPRFDTPDTSVVSRTYSAHPKAQCRLDTYLQGSLCAQPVTAELDNHDAAAGACTRSGGFSVGLRPLCWYKPPRSEARLDEIADAVAPAPRSSPALTSLAGDPFRGL